MKLYSNLSYLFRPKRLSLLPECFRRYIFNNRVQLETFAKACAYRSSLMEDNGKLEGKSRTISEMASIETMRPILGGVLQKIAGTFELCSALEFGTSLGVGTMFLATSVKGRVTTVDCNRAVVDFASDMFNAEGVDNVDFVCDTFEHYLQESRGKFDLVYVDGDHTGVSMRSQYERLIRDFVGEKYVLVFDDINYSRDMSDAWKSISAASGDSLRINLFRWGMIFHGYDLPRREICAYIRL